MKFIFLMVFVLLHPISYADCIDESKDLDSCLQCCTDVTQTAQVLKDNPEWALNIANICKTADWTSSSEYKVHYAKYKVEGSVYLTACKNNDFVDTNKFTAQSYNKCIDACEKKIKSKNK